METEVARHKTAISRTELSRPIRLAIDDGLLACDRTIFDYGCGLGDDLRLLQGNGYTCAGWDPVHHADAPKHPAAVVNLGYVINVIENPHERAAALRAAWSLAEQILIVSARMTPDARALNEAQDFADGLLTSRGTFQKFFDQHELRTWIDHTLSTNSVPAAPGVFYVFRDEGARTSFVASRVRRRIIVPRLTRSAELFQQHEALLAPLMAFFGDRGRLPEDGELPSAAALRATFGSIRSAFRVVLRVTDKDRWDIVARMRAQDLCIYLALARFSGRPSFGKLPRGLQLDVRDFFSTYAQACKEADQLLFSLGAPGIVESACRDSELGKLTPSALYVHESVLDQLAPVLRLFEGCARAYIGRVDGTNLIKLHRFEPKISYLNYPGFDIDPHPCLAGSTTVHLQTFRVKTRDYRAYVNPPILHRKENFVAREHPLYEKFARLTRIEERKGLYHDTARIGTRDGWCQILTEKGLRLHGHRLMRTQRQL